MKIEVWVSGSRGSEYSSVEELKESGWVVCQEEGFTDYHQWWNTTDVVINFPDKPGQARATESFVVWRAGRIAVGSPAHYVEWNGSLSECAEVAKAWQNFEGSEEEFLTRISSR
jgi:hypothetical protein